MAQRRRRPARAPKSALGTLIVIILAAFVWAGSELGLFDNVTLGPRATPLPGDGLYVTFIDVGQGDSTLAVCEGETLLIDAGVPEAGPEVAEYLESVGVTELDYVVCTHAHEDHVGGLDYILENFGVGTIFAPYTEFDASGSFTHFEDTAAELGLEITVPPLGAEFTLGGAVFEFVGPVTDWDGDVNDSSLVLRLDYGDDSFLFTGDISDGPLADCAYIGGYDLGCDVLKHLDRRGNTRPHHARGRRRELRARQLLRPPARRGSGALRRARHPPPPHRPRRRHHPPLQRRGDNKNNHPLRGVKKPPLSGGFAGRRGSFYVWRGSGGGDGIVLYQEADIAGVDGGVEGGEVVAGVVIEPA